MLSRNERGATVVLFAILATVMLGVGAFAVDAGRVYATRAAMQEAVDKAAVAAAMKVEPRSCTAATAEAKTILAKNWPSVSGNNLSSPASISLNGSIAGGKIVCGADSSVTLTAPAARVDFGLAKALSRANNSYGVRVRAKAAAFSPASSKIFPAYATVSANPLLDTCSYGYHTLIRGPKGPLLEELVDSVFQLDTGTCQIISGSYGSLRMPRARNLNEVDELAANMAAGPTFSLAAHPSPSYGVCGSQGTDILAPTNGTNCLTALPGNRAKAGQKGLITGVQDGPTWRDGLLNRPTSSQCKEDALLRNPSRLSLNLFPRTDLSVAGKSGINNDRLECFLTVSSTVSGLLDILLPSYSGPPMLDPKIVESPRFVWVPVINYPKCIPLPLLPCWNGDDTPNDTVGHKGPYRIITFRPGFIQGFFGALPSPTSCKSCLQNGLSIDKQGDLDSVSVLLFSEKALPSYMKSLTTQSYLGFGPKVIRLVD